MGRSIGISVSLICCFAVISVSSGGQSIDENGYIMYCPCMGRFGNQAEQFLGSLLFAKHLDRTLVLPPFIEYRDYQVFFAPFDDYFKLGPFEGHHRVITMESFMADIAPKHWPESERRIMCYGSRKNNEDNGNPSSTCNPFAGSPFKPFWFNFNITHFEKDIFYQPLVTHFTQAEIWKAKFQNTKVLTFVGAPSSFPTNQEAIPLQRFVRFSDSIAEKASEYREERNFTGKPFLAIHLRHGSDWIKACDLLKDNEMSQLFSSRQCTDRMTVPMEKFKLPYELCSQSADLIIDDIKQALSTAGQQLEVIYIATDHDDNKLWEQIHQELLNVKLVTPTTTYENGKSTEGFAPPHYIIDSHLMASSDYFIGNCISSFSAFVSRLRVHSPSYQNLKSTKFFAENSLNLYNLQPSKDEL